MGALLTERRDDLEAIMLYLLPSILVPVDFSSCSRRALDYALRFAGCVKAPVEVLHAYREPDGYVPRIAVSGVSGPKRTVRGIARSEGARGLEELLQAVLLPTTQRPHTVLVTGDPAEAILERASSQGHGMIIMGTRGRTGLAHWLLGSVAEQVVRRAPCPVLTIPPARLTGSDQARPRRMARSA